jgi:hypothetical protein
VFLQIARELSPTGEMGIGNDQVKVELWGIVVEDLAMFER